MKKFLDLINTTPLFLTFWRGRGKMKEEKLRNIIIRYILEYLEKS